MSIEIVSSPSSSTTCNEIVGVGDTYRTSSDNPFQINQENDKTASGFAGDHPKENKSRSKLTFLRLPFKFRLRNSKLKSIDNKFTRSDEDDENNNNKGGPGDDRSRFAEQLSNMIATDLNLMKKASERTRKYELQIEELFHRFYQLKQKGGSADDLSNLRDLVKKLKQQIKYEPESHPAMAKYEHDCDTSEFDECPNLYKYPGFEKSLAFQEFETCYHKLDVVLKMCLLCFAVFPENAEIKKKAMMYWWIGEGFVPPHQWEVLNTHTVTAEDSANMFFHTLISEGFIEPLYKKSRLNGCKMHPFVRSMVIRLAARANFLDFDDKGNVKEDYSLSLRCCLTGKGLTKTKDLRKLHALFNVNQTILDFKPEWFLRMTNVNVIYLGRWQTSPRHHIEVEYTIKSEKLLDGLKNSKHLRFLSLQGISRIVQLPESISKLTDLVILDVRACQNLEEIPQGIGLLKNLTHLDMSDCNLLDYMPKGLALLSQLQVLHGFVVRGSDRKNPCTLDDLRKLSKLRKLSIQTGDNSFPTDRDQRALNQFQVLRKLTITWRRNSSQVKRVDTSGNGDNSTAVSEPLLPGRLIKLDLRCFPGKCTPSWLRPSNLRSLTKLYIRGGKYPFPDLGQFPDLADDEEELAVLRAPEYKWKVEELRLKYLTDLEMNWSELHELFPKLIYLEKVKCPKLTLFPCNEYGVWNKKTVK